MANDRKKLEMFNGLEDGAILFDDDLDLEDKELTRDDNGMLVDEEVYKQWLEEGIKQQKGYGTKDSYEGEIPEDDGQSYYNSYRYREHIRSDTTEAMIVRLKERDNRVAQRDRIIAYSLPMGHKVLPPGDNMELLGKLIVFVFSYFIGTAVGAMFHLEGMDRTLFGGIGLYIGTIIKNNGIDGYTLSDSIARSKFNLCVLIYIAVLWVCKMIGVEILLPVYLVYFIFFVFAAVFHFRKEYTFDKKMIFYKTLAASCSMLLVIVVPIILNFITTLLFGVPIFPYHYAWTAF